jgi:hypothetical protein
MCRSCVARYIDMTFPLAEACETCRAESPSGQPWLLGSLKKFQLACQYATPRCKKRMLTGGRDHAWNVPAEASAARAAGHMSACVGDADDVA